MPTPHATPPEVTASLDAGKLVIVAPIAIPEYLICGALFAAWDGGSNYWACKATGYPVHDDAPDTPVEKWTLDLPQSLTEFDPDGNDDDVRHELTREKIQRALVLMAEKYPRHFANLIGDNSDAETGDVLLQLALLGEIKYG